MSKKALLFRKILFTKTGGWLDCPVGHSLPSTVLDHQTFALDQVLKNTRDRRYAFYKELPYRRNEMNNPIRPNFIPLQLVGLDLLIC